MNKYFDNIIYFLQKSGGGSVYWGEITKAFKDQNDSFFIQPNLPCNNIVYKDLKLTNIIFEKFWPLQLLRYTPCNLKIDEKSIFHSSYYRFSNSYNVKNVVTVHDFTTEYFAKGLSRYIHHLQKGIAVKKAAGVICISEKTKKDLFKFYPDFVKGKKVEVIYNGVSENYFIENETSGVKFKFGLNEDFKYILYLGHRTKYKNFDFAIDVIYNLPKNYKLIIVGSELLVNEKKNLLKIENQFVFLGSLDNYDLNLIYNVAECLLYPSSYEGFGIPLIEAFKCGCPVIAQDLEVFREISNESAILIKELDINKFKNKILELNIGKIKTELILSGLNQAQKYSWNKCTTQVNEFYNTI